MGGLAIQVEGLGKRYQIGARQEPYLTLRESIMRAARAPFQRAARLLRGQASGASDLGDPFWALDDLSFEVPRGQVLGVIGANGAGKSTLLKILSRITEPTTGCITLHGRVGSLLEVGTGFHPELTGRENIFLNGAILGMRRAEIARKFDEIVAFAEVDRFIDTPVKHYSSGMYTRLAFSVAAHLETEILLVDEVLAVGDIAFQQKCLGKMETVARTGRTVLFVSHQLGMIRQLCQRALLLEGGRLVRDGPVAEVVEHYTTHRLRASSELRLAPNQQRDGQFLRLSAMRATGSVTTFSHDEPISLELDFLLRAPRLHDLMLGVTVLDQTKRRVFTTQQPLPPPEAPTRYQMRVTVPACTLTPGHYSFSVALHIPFVHLLDMQDDVVPFTIIDGGSEFAQHEGGDYGVVFVPCDWQLIHRAEAADD